MFEEQSNVGKGLGVAGLIFGIFAISLSLIPCTFLLGLLFGILGIVFGSISYSHIKRANGSTNISVSALSVSIVGICIALLVSLFFLDKPINEWTNYSKKIQKSFEENYEDKNVEDETEKEFSDEIEKNLNDLEDSVGTEKKESSIKSANKKKDKTQTNQSVEDFIKEFSDTTDN